MIRITFELLPGGAEDRARTIGIMELANVTTRLDGTADYAVVMHKTPPFKGALRDAWRKGLVSSNGEAIDRANAGDDEELIVALATGHHRTRRGVYDLFFRALCACGLDKRNAP